MKHIPAFTPSSALPHHNTLKPKEKKGHIAIVGAGPGARDLLTLRAVDRLQSADDWRNMINQSKKQKSDLLAEVETKERLGVVLTQLVEETNEVVRKSQLVRIEEPE